MTSIIVASIIAGALLARLILYIVDWHNSDKEARVNATLAKNRRAWQYEIQRAGQRLRDADKRAAEEAERKRILAENRRKQLRVTLKGTAVNYADAWE